MKKLNKFTASALSLFSLGQILLMGTSLPLTSAVLIFSGAQKANAETFYSYFSRGHKKFMDEDYEGAILEFNKAINLKPKNKDIYYNRGMAKGLAGDMSGACSDFQIASSFGNKGAKELVERDC